MDAPFLPTRKCPCCKALFVPMPQSRATQRFCSAVACRKASKTQSNARWRKKNPGYDRGPLQVARVQRWRRENPDRARAKRRKKTVAALQDLDPAQVTAAQSLAEIASCPASDLFPGAPPSTSCNEAQEPTRAVALQDLDPIQLPLFVGFIATLAGGALQDTFAPFARNLVEQGRRVMAQHPDLFGLRGASKNTQLDLLQL